MSQLLAGKHALVTGGARGIGAAVTRQLLTHGARVTTLGRTSAPDQIEDPTGKHRELQHIVADVAYLRVPVAFDPSRQPHSKIYYALEALNRLEDMHDKVFDVIHNGHRTLLDENDIAPVANRSTICSAW